MEQKKTFLKDLEVSQLDWILKNNSDINEKVESLYIEDMMTFIDEQLTTFKGTLADWSIGFYNQNFIRVENDLGFIYAYEDFSKWYGVSDETQKLLDEALDFIKNNDIDFEISTMEELNAREELQEKAEKLAKELKKDLLEYFDRLTTIDNDCLWDTFCFMLEVDIFDDYYILGDDLSTIYIDISYTKTLK